MNALQKTRRGLYRAVREHRCTKHALLSVDRCDPLQLRVPDDRACASILQKNVVFDLPDVTKFGGKVSFNDSQNFDNSEAQTFNSESPEKIATRFGHDGRSSFDGSCACILACNRRNET